MNTPDDLKKIAAQLEEIRCLSEDTKRNIARMNWKIARDMWRYRVKFGSSAVADITNILKKVANPDDRKGASNSKLTKLVVIGKFSPQDLERLGIPEVDPFVFLQHKARFVDPKTKQLLNTGEAREIVQRLREGASDFQLRKLTRKGTKY